MISLEPVQNVLRVRSDATTVSVCRRTNFATQWFPAGTVATSLEEHAGRAITAELPRDTVRSDATMEGVVPTQ